MGSSRAIKGGNIKFGVAFPAQVPRVGRNDVLGFAERAERLGFDSLWVLDRLVYDSMAPLPLLAAAAGMTSRVRLGTSILLATQHSPLVLAKELATIDRISGGRLTIGVAIGGRDVDFEAAVVPMRSRARRFEETIALLKQAWSGAPIDYDGSIFSIHVPPTGPIPLQRPYPPIWLGGRSQAAIERAVRVADGYIPGGSGPAALRHELERLYEAADRAGRDRKTIACGAVVYFYLDPNTEVALAGVTRYLQAYYGAALKLNPLEDTVYGTPRQTAGRIREFADLDLDTLIFVPTSSDPEQVNLLAESVELASSKS